MEQLAITSADGRVPLHRVMADVNATLGKGLSVVVITPSTDPTWLNSLALVRQRASAPSVILLDGASFGDAPPATGLAAQLATAGLVVHVVQKGQEFRTITVDKKDWEQQRRAQVIPIR
jgi:hypothetical protein